MFGDRADDGLVGLPGGESEDVDGDQTRVVGGEVAVGVVDMAQEGVLLGGVGPALTMGGPGDASSAGRRSHTATSAVGPDIAETDRSHPMPSAGWPGCFCKRVVRL